MRFPVASPPSVLPRDAGQEVSSRAQPEQLLQEALIAHLPVRSPLRVLDAGCGGKMKVPLPDDIEITGIDISVESIARNTNLDRAIVGDIQTFDFSGVEYDVILCWDVLEHVPDPRQAVRNLLTALAPGGIAVLALPNALSVKGLFTKATPHAVHTLFVRRLLGNENAGKPGHGPFPLFLPFSLSLGRLRNLVENCGVEVAYAHAYEGPQVRKLRRRVPSAYVIYRIVCAVATVVSLGRLPARLSDLHMIVKRR